MIRGQGLNTRPGFAHWGKNSGFHALNLAYHYGVKRILLMGYDMQRTGGQSHWHGDHPKGMRNADTVASWAAEFPALAADLAREGVEVINCTRETALTCFPRMTIQEALQ